MSYPYQHAQTVFADQAASATTALDEAFKACAVKVVEIIPTAFTGTLDIQGAIGGASTPDNVSYSVMGGNGAKGPTNAQYTFTASSTRVRLLVREPYVSMQLVLGWNAGSVTVNVYGWEQAMGLAASDGLVGSFTDRSGTITTGGTAQTLMAVNSARRYLLVENPRSLAAGTYNPQESLFVNFTTTATRCQPSIEIEIGGSYELDASGFVSTELVSVIAATTGHAFVAKEG